MNSHDGPGIPRREFLKAAACIASALLPTFLDAAGATIPSHLDGRSLHYDRQLQSTTDLFQPT
jgi:arylsulfatase A-like enzyme